MAVITVVSLSCVTNSNQRHKACTIIDAYLFCVVSQVATQPLSPAGVEWTSQILPPGVKQFAPPPVTFLPAGHHAVADGKRHASAVTLTTCTSLSPTFCQRPDWHTGVMIDPLPGIIIIYPESRRRVKVTREIELI
ncbi:hypothetical protein VQ422_004803 [Salmonella enterica]|nr:hypothetical protein [Salmonella enterica]